MVATFSGVLVEVPPAGLGVDDGSRPVVPASPGVRRAPWRRWAVPYLYLLPAIGVVGVWIYRPLVEIAQLSVFQWNLLPTSPKRPVGGANYRRVLELPALHQASANSLRYVIGLLLFTVVLPTGIALVGARLGRRPRDVYGAIAFVPVLVPPVAVAALWQWMLDPRGLVNQLLRLVGVPPQNWLHESSVALPAIILMTGWHTLGLAVLIVTAGLANIDAEYAAAAELDGASRWQITRWVTLPLLTPSIMMMVLVTVILTGVWTFPMIDALTQGGPSQATTNLNYLLWQFGFRSFNIGLAAAAGVLFCVVFSVIAIGLLRLTDRFSFHDS